MRTTTGHFSVHLGRCGWRFVQYMQDWSRHVSLLLLLLWICIIFDKISGDQDDLNFICFFEKKERGEALKFSIFRVWSGSSKINSAPTQSRNPDRPAVGARRGISSASSKGTPRSAVQCRTAKYIIIYTCRFCNDGYGGILQPKPVLWWSPPYRADTRMLFDAKDPEMMRSGKVRSGLRQRIPEAPG